jgi:hypothetical protein
VSEPNKIACGATVCDAGGAGPNADYCCERPDGGEQCANKGNQCGGGLRLNCDEKADCMNGNECCLSFGGGASDCQNGCVNSQLHLCRTTAECGDAGACKQVTCTGGGTFGTYYACNTTTNCK